MKKILKRSAVLTALALIAIALSPQRGLRDIWTTDNGQTPDNSWPPDKSWPLLGTLTNPSPLAKWISVNGSAQNSSDLDLLNDDPYKPQLGIKLPGFFHERVYIGKRACSRVNIPGQVAYQVKGLPEVPVISRSVKVPTGARVTLKIADHIVQEYKMDPIEPSRGHIDRNVDLGSVGPTFSDFYQNNAVWPKVEAELGEVFRYGPYSGINVRVYPIRYDSGKGLVLVTQRLILDLIVEDTLGNAKSTTIDVSPSTRETALVHRQIFGTEAPQAANKYDAPADRGRMLIITAPELEEGLDKFVLWKRQLGIPVTVRNTDETGATTADIAQAIVDAYAQPEGLTWVILVGDHRQIPPHTGGYDGSDSDSRYARLMGDDLYPDVYISRISAQNLDQLDIQLNKFITYEKYPQKEDGGWYRRAANIASAEGNPPDYERAEQLGSDLIGYGFSNVISIYEGQGGNSTAITNAVNEGVSAINYLGHGEGDYWSSIYFGTSQVRSLKNYPNWPWIVDVSCLNGHFAMDECFAEAWLRAGTADTPQGAVGMIASTSNAPWVPPTLMQAEIVDLVTQEATFSLGSLFYCGLMKVVDSYTGVDVAEQVMDQNVIFGDCSLMIRTDKPTLFTVAGPTDLSRAGGTWDGAVEGPVGSIATLTNDSEILAVAEIGADGLLVLPYTRQHDDEDRITLTISGPNMVPYIQQFSFSGAQDPAPDSELPTEVTLLGNFPNPFNPATTIAFDLPQAMSVRLRVFDLRGRLVKTLVDETREAGRQEIIWNGTNASGSPVASGIYLYQLDTPEGSRTGRMTLSK